MSDASDLSGVAPAPGPGVQGGVESAGGWALTSTGQARGYIQATALKEVWFHTGTICNLACPFCLEGSHPGDRRLEALTLEDVRPYLVEARELGVGQFSFTGGEPFVVREIVDILRAALRQGDCLVLTNGTIPLRRRLDQVVELGRGAHTLSFRVSLDHPDPGRHDEARGEGNFRLALETLAELYGRGFPVSVARQSSPDEDVARVRRAYRAWFERAGLPPDTRIVAFTDLGGPGEDRDVPEITEDCMTRYHTAESRAAFMCAFSRMVVKRHGRTRVYACTLVDDRESYDLGATLRESLRDPVRLGHHRCYTCFSRGTSCSEL